MAEARHNGLENEPRSTRDGGEAAKRAHEEAQKQVDAAQDAYDALTSGVDSPHLSAAWNEVQRAQSELAATAVIGPGNTGDSLSVEALLDQVEAARAARDLAVANLASVKDGTRKEQIDAALAQVDVAQAQVDAFAVQLDKLTITAPSDGVAMARSVEPGEVVMPGAVLFEIGRLNTLELTVYVPEGQLGRVTPGQRVNVKVDTYPDRGFSGTVLRLADEAEFTPTNVQTKEDRTRLVYAVVIQLDNPDLSLKPGMMADVEFKQ
jgi:multidrug resistance efflux pump